MLHIFRKSAGRDAEDGRRGVDSALSSHILKTFLKRLAGRTRPYLLDLGSLSGSNIEFFARHGCKVQVEDLLAVFETDAPATGRGPAHADAPLQEEAPPRDGTAGAGASSDAAASSGDVASPLPVEIEVARAPRRAPGSPARPTVAQPGVFQAGAARVGAALPSPSSTGAPGVAGAPGAATSAGPSRAGARPSRRIVLPPRTFAGRSSAGRPRHEPAASRSSIATAARDGGSVVAADLPTSFAYPDETFDAVVAWDRFNYYEPAAARLIAAQIRRILKPGGLVLAYFHARHAEGPDAPRRFRIVDEKRVLQEPMPGRPLSRHVYQNRDIEKMFTGLGIVELYFLKNSLRELLMEKRAGLTPKSKPLVGPVAPKPPRFTIE